ncbi:hypothetical protein KY285_005300 [Solanum tuberosum]|nr:hypothetical protein KY285_005300 [Solanum tuberosum]
MCKRFLWNGETQVKGKALVVWDILCWPKVAGGLNVIDIYMWNKTAILKHLWDLNKKKDKLWIVWVHTFYLKGRKPWEVIVNQASWIVRKILQARHWLEEKGLQIAEVMETNELSINAMYKKLRGEYIKVPWRRMTCNNQGSPKWLFALYLAINRRLYTRDRLARWGITNDTLCPLCMEAHETHQHLFFTCIYSRMLCQKLLNWLSINRASNGWTEELNWAVEHASSKTIIAEVYRMTLAAIIYYIWQERNYRIFQNKERNIEMINRAIIQGIHCRASMIPRFIGFMQKLNFYP